MNVLLNDVIQKNTPYAKGGKAANYILELAKVEGHKLGICLVANRATASQG